MRTLLGLALLLLSFAAHATDTLAFGNRVLVSGDGVARVIELAGQPDRKEVIENKRGAAIGERWEYYRDGKTVLVTLKDAVVVRIKEVR